MNRFIAEITEIESVQTLHRIQLASHSCVLSMVSLELAENVQVGTKVQLYVKSSNIILSRNKDIQLSIANQLPVRIVSIKEGVVLTTLKVDFYGIVLESMITTEQAKKLHLKEEENIFAFINESDLSLSVLEQ